LLHVAIYDAMVAAWDSKYAYNRRLMLDSRVVDMRMVYTDHIPCLNP